VRSRNHWCSGKAITIAYSECVSVALGTQLARRMRPVVLQSAACPAVPHFSTLSNKRRDFRHAFAEHKTCVLNFSTILPRNFPNSEKN